MTKKAPIRTCIACHESADKQSLLRFVRTPAGAVEFDPSGKAAGRGAYVCADDACFEKACNKSMLGARLRTKVGRDDYERLKEAFASFMQAEDVRE